jgi:hypothetical protein
MYALHNIDLIIQMYTMKHRHNTHYIAPTSLQLSIHQSYAYIGYGRNGLLKTGNQIFPDTNLVIVTRTRIFVFYIPVLVSPKLVLNTFRRID